jgi:hypothetical protein
MIRNGNSFSSIKTGFVKRVFIKVGLSIPKATVTF